MKWIAFSLVTGLANAFQSSSVNIHSYHLTALRFYPKEFERAQECAIHSGTCAIEELEHLADELEAFHVSENGGGLQDRDCYVDTQQVIKMLRSQSDLKHMIESYVVSHHQVRAVPQ